MFGASRHLLSHVLWSHLHHQPITLLEDLLPRHLQPAVTGLRLERLQLRPQRSQLPHQVPSVLRQFTFKQPDGQVGDGAAAGCGLLGRRQSARHRRVGDDIRAVLDDVVRPDDRRRSVGCLRLCSAGSGALCRRPSQRIQHLSVEPRVGELRRPVVVVDEVIPARRRLPLLPPARQLTQLLRRDVLRVEIARDARIMPRRDARWNVKEVNLTLLRRSHLVAGRQVDGGSRSIRSHSGADDDRNLPGLSLPLTSLGLVLTSR